jgi:hypothetical protein
MNRGMQFLDDAFNSNSPTIPAQSVGGSREIVQARHDAQTQNDSAPQASARIYNSGALKLYEPPEGEKADNVENIYLPRNRAAETAGDKSQGGATIPPSANAGLGDKFVHWLKTGHWS